MELKMRLHMSRIPTRFRKEPKKKYDVKSLAGNCKALLKHCYQTVLNFLTFSIDSCSKIEYYIYRNHEFLA